jgi:hypothetical protein
MPDIGGFQGWFWESDTDGLLPLKIPFRYLQLNTFSPQLVSAVYCAPGDVWTTSDSYAGCVNSAVTALATGCTNGVGGGGAVVSIWRQ